MKPGERDMSMYFDSSGSGICSGLPICMTDPVLLIPGDCEEITKQSDCLAD